MTILRRNDRGAILIIVMIMIMVIAGMSAALMIVATANARTAEQAAQYETSLQLAEGGVDRALADLGASGTGNIGTASWDATKNDVGADGVAGTSDPGEGDGRPTAGEPNVTPVSLGGGQVFTWTTNLATDPQIRATGSYGNAWRSIVASAKAQPSLPLPDPNKNPALSAFAILGSLDKAKIKLHDTLAKSKDDAAGAGLVFNGNDKAGVKSKITGMGIEDNETYNEFAERYEKDVIKGKLDDLTLQGLDKTVNYSTKKGSGSFTASLENVGDGNTATDFLRSLGDKIQAAVEKNIIPNADIQISGKDAKIDSNTTWGTDSSPKITVIDATKLTIDKGATVTGSGVLVVEGRLDLHHASFSFNGPVIVLGDTNKDSRIHNHHASMTINGPLAVIANDKGKASVHIHNENNVSGGSHSTTINGAFLGLATDGTKKNESRFHYHHGTAVINGYFGLFGDDRAKMHIHGLKDNKNGTTGSFTANGATMIGSTVDLDDNTKGRVDVHLHGRNLGFNYDSVELAKGLKSITDLIGSVSPNSPVLPPSSFVIVGWQDLGWVR
ncbi:MAG: hypothetical protein L0216_16100 [Planctomycetales bacterium]|nr:hypothetical protein [Planctomycetales bacterium]